MARAPGLAGSVRWAVVPYAPRPPFRLYAGRDQPPHSVPGPDPLIDAVAQGGDPELTYLVPGKARPILILSDSPDERRKEVSALRLLRFSRLDSRQQQAIREQKEPLLFHLPPSRFRLPEENAVMVSTIVRVHTEAISSRPPAGALNENEMRVVAERLVEFLGLDLQLLVNRRIQELVERRRAAAPE